MTIIFKKGDTVKMVENEGLGQVGVKNGDLLKVLSVEDDGEWLELETKIGITFGAFSFRFELAQKQVTIDVCHQLVAYDCELGCLQARIDNLREDHQRQVDQLTCSIESLTKEMNRLKAEYNVE